MKQKRILLLFFLLAVTACTNQESIYKASLTPTRIDSLTTNAEIEQYIGDCDSLYRKFTLQKVQDIVCISCDTLLDNLANRLNIDFSWQKADLDNNGYTDLLATGTNKTYGNWNFDPNREVEYSKEFNAFVIMNFGPEKTKLFDLTEGHYPSIVARVEYDSLKPFVGVYTPKLNAFLKESRRPETKSKLTYKFGNFIEYNPAPKEYDIEKIEYTTTPCNGECPLFSIIIHENGDAIFAANKYNYTLPWQKGKLISGTFKTTIKDENLEELITILNYTDFPNLKDNYNVPWTCDRSGVLKVTYNDGQTKTIDDYGVQGTYGLRKLHSLFHELRTNQNWKLISKEAPYDYSIMKRY
ncbi:DUF6438 domain-containing protein [Flavobacterium sp. RNTU_13]|uniref:DUF6438 domain-containing protein n=1 Tax=Flavobacterium sp. RNTU_13 TaxID=3375145 RepID=UPI0039870CC4